MIKVLIDLYCKAGGCSKGYKEAGFDEIIGVDIEPQKHYPYEFIQCDWAEALSYLPGLLERSGKKYAIHASPPCQRYSTMTGRWNRNMDHPDLIPPTRERLEEIGVPYVIENVVGAPLNMDKAVMLCGTMFGLKSQGYELQRHRLFECSWGKIAAPAECNHVAQPLPVYGHAGGRSKRDGLKFPGTDAWREGMGIDWMTGNELAESIPPAYTKWVGLELIKYV